MKNRNVKRLFVSSFMVFMAAALIMSLPAVAKEKRKHHHGDEAEMVYQTVPVTIQMEAGSTEWNAWTSGTTIIAGTGWVAPFGRSDYHYGYGFDEAADDGAAPKPDFMDDTWLAAFPTNNLCIYHLSDGDIYAYDGIMANVEAATGDGKMDYVMEIVVGGTGRYRDANGILLGKTPGRGTAAKVTDGDGNESPYPLPPVIVKVMEGYMNILVKETDVRPMLPAVGTKNPQTWPEALEYLDGGYLIPVNIEMEAGRDQWNVYTSGSTIIAGTGWVEPFGRSDYHYGFGYDEAQSGAAGEKPSYMNDTWLESYPTNNLCIYHLDGGDIYAYDGTMGNLVPESDDGKVDCVLEVIVGGSGDYVDATGMLVGYTFGRGEAAVPDDQTLDIELPDSILKIMEGYILIKPADDGEEDEA